MAELRPRDAGETRSLGPPSEKAVIRLPSGPAKNRRLGHPRALSRQPRPRETSPGESSAALGGAAAELGSGPGRPGEAERPLQPARCRVPGRSPAAVSRSPRPTRQAATAGGVRAPRPRPPPGAALPPALRSRGRRRPPPPRSLRPAPAPDTARSPLPCTAEKGEREDTAASAL